MRKNFILLALVAIAGFSTMNTTKAQTDNFELGVRIDGAFGNYGGALDAMIPLGENRLHGNLSFGGWGLGASIIHDWQYTFGNGVDGHGEWLWYPGIGAGIGIWDDGYAGNGVGGVGISIMGEFGLEYEFEFPMALGFDIRPTIGIGDGINNDGFGFGVGAGLNCRYRF